MGRGAPGRAPGLARDRGGTDLRILLIAACTGLLAAPAAPASDAPAAGPRLEPYVADYDVKYGRLAVGGSRTTLAQEGGHWVIELRTQASGLYRMIASGVLRQRSTFELRAEGVRPQGYRFDDGTEDTDRDVALDFDWSAGRVRGTAEDARVDLATVPGLQDAASMQAEVVARLRAGREPGTVAMIEKDKVKYYRYAFLRRETLQTALGEMDCLVYRSARDGSGRETLTWHAPSLGFVAVKAEQLVDGKRGFQTTLRSFRRGP